MPEKIAPKVLSWATDIDDKAARSHTLHQVLNYKGTS